MSGAPPPQHFVAYPRGNTPNAYGSADKLEALGKGYKNLNYVFIANLFAFMAANVLRGVMGMAGYFIGLPLLFLLVAGLTYPQNKRIGFGKDWSPSGAVIASLLMGLNSVLCCGIIGYIVMQNIAVTEMKKYGAKPGFFGIGKDFDTILAARRQAEATPPPPGPMV